MRERNLKGRFSVLLVMASAAKASPRSPLKRASNKIAKLPSRKTAGLVTLRESRLNTAKSRFFRPPNARGCKQPQTKRMPQLTNITQTGRFISFNLFDALH